MSEWRSPTVESRHSGRGDGSELLWPGIFVILVHEAHQVRDRRLVCLIFILQARSPHSGSSPRERWALPRGRSSVTQPGRRCRPCQADAMGMIIPSSPEGTCWSSTCD